MGSSCMPNGTWPGMGSAWVKVERSRGSKAQVDDERMAVEGERMQR